MTKHQIITRLIKEDNITLEEAMILYNDNFVNLPYVIPPPPYINPYYWEVTCSDSSEYRKPYDPEEYKEKH